MTVKELIKRLLGLPISIEEATVRFKDGKLLVVVNKEDSSEVYTIE